MSIASLPMYDLPEIRTETDMLWAAIRDAIRARGIAAPDALDRSTSPSEHWTDPDLILSQTCGMPWRLGLHREAQLVGTPYYAIEGCPPGYYHSKIVVRADDPRDTVAAFAGATCAYNANNSQSGYAAMLEVAADGTFGAWLETGAHAASITAVATGKADIAAIDAITWQLAMKYHPDSATLRVLTHTAPTPGLPYITAKTQDADQIAEAAAEAISSLDQKTRDALGLVGLVRIPTEDYLRV